MRIMLGLSAALALCLVSCSSESVRSDDPADPTVIAAAVNDPDRATQRASDPQRHPAEVMTFVGVRPGDKVLELIPGTGYWTRLLSKIVGEKGHVYAVWPQQYARYSTGNVASLKDMAGKPPFANVSVQVLPTPVLSAPEPLDVLFTSQNYHDYPAEFMGNNDPAVLNDAAFKMLRRGGIYIVIDHRAAPGTSIEQTREMHRIDPALVRQQVEKAGFVYSGETNVLRSTDDDYTVAVFDPKVRGHTDKFALKFRKP
jgi:predicted methyltransferase